MSDLFWNHLFTFLTLCFTGWIGYKMKVLDRVSKQIDNVEHHTNSMKDALVLAAKEKGELQGASDERARADLRDDENESNKGLHA